MQTHILTHCNNLLQINLTKCRNHSTRRTHPPILRKHKVKKKKCMEKVKASQASATTRTVRMLERCLIYSNSNLRMAAILLKNSITSEPMKNQRSFKVTKGSISITCLSKRIHQMRILKQSRQTD